MLQIGLLLLLCQQVEVTRQLEVEEATGSVFEEAWGR